MSGASLDLGNMMHADTVMTEAVWDVATDVKTNNMRKKIKQKPKGPVKKRINAKLQMKKMC